MSLTAVPGSSLTATLRVLGGAATATDSGPLSGTLGVDPLGGGGCGGLLQSLALSTSDLLAGRLDFLINLGPLGSIQASLIDARLELTAPTTTVNFDGTLDLQGARLRLQGGTLQYSGSGSLGGVLGSGSIDFAAAPISSGLAGGSPPAVVDLEPVTNVVQYSLDLPWSASLTLLTAPLAITADFTARAEFTGTLLPGDANGDGQVSGADFTVWADNFGQSPATIGDGDFTCDGVVTGADYTVWADRFGQSRAVPEPASWQLVVLLAAASAAAWRTR